MHAEALAAEGFCIDDEYLNRAQVRALRACLEERARRGEFAAAKIGAGDRGQHLASVRGDETCWLSEPVAEAERLLLERLEALRLAFNRELYLGLFDLELHYARYPCGAAYARHLDQPQGRSQRRVSLVIYLNDGWREEDGGELRLYEAGGWHEVLPLGGRLVCFRSADREHEVRPARRERLSLTGWFRVRES